MSNVEWSVSFGVQTDLVHLVGCCCGAVNLPERQVPTGERPISLNAARFIQLIMAWSLLIAAMRSGQNQCPDSGTDTLPADGNHFALSVLCRGLLLSLDLSFQ